MSNLIRFVAADGSDVAVSAANPLPVSGGGGGGGGSSSDFEFVVSTYRVKTGFSGASVNDVVTATQVIDMTSGTPVTSTTIWRNQTTAADLASVPSAANLNLVGSEALTDAQLRATAVAISAAALPLPAGAATSAKQDSLISLLPATIGQKAAAASLGVVLASDQTLPLPAGAATSANQTAQTTLFGAVTETAPASDTASSGLNGRLQRVAQRISSLISLLPTTIGQKASAASLAVVVASDQIVPTGGVTATPSATLTRPADVIAYAIGDLVANSTTAGSVTPLSITASRIAAGSGIIRRMQLRKSSAGLTNALFRVHLFSAAPTVSNGDNGVLAMTGVANYIGRCDIALDQAFNDGAWGSSDMTFSDEHFKLSSGQIVYALLEARGAYTPVSGETFTLVAEVVQD